MNEDSIIVTICDRKSFKTNHCICTENQVMIDKPDTLEGLNLKLKERFTDDIDISFYFYLDDDGEKIRIENDDDYYSMIDYFNSKTVNVICLFALLKNYNEIKEVSNKVIQSGIEKKEKEKEIQLDNAINELITKSNIALKKELLKLVQNNNKKPNILFNRLCSECSSLIKGRLYHCSKCKDYYLCDDCLSYTSHSHNLEVILNNNIQY